jgi:hypothetical protein
MPCPGPTLSSARVLKNLSASEKCVRVLRCEGVQCRRKRFHFTTSTIRFGSFFWFVHSLGESARTDHDATDPIDI